MTHTHVLSAPAMPVAQHVAQHAAPPALTPVNTIADYVNAAVTPYVSPALISDNAMNNIQRIARQLPGALTEFFGFECPLGTAEPTADFLVCIKASEGALEVLTGQKPGREIPAAFQSHGVWHRILALATEWADAKSALHERIHNLWLEFDVDGPPAAIPVPSAFLGSERLRRPENCEWLAGQALPLLLGRSVDPASETQIMRCVDLLPEGAYIFQVGLMLARTSRATRLCVRGISPAQIVDYLEALRWTGQGELLIETLGQMTGRVDRIDLDIDVADQVLPKIGLECYPTMWPEATEHLLDSLVESGLSTPGKAAGLKAWRGMAHERLTPERWPGELSALSAFLDGRVHSTFVRWLHHVKLVLQPEMPLQAKAYLAVRHQWIQPGELKKALKGGVKPA